MATERLLGPLGVIVTIHQVHRDVCGTRTEYRLSPFLTETFTSSELPSARGPRAAGRTYWTYGSRHAIPGDAAG